MTHYRNGNGEQIRFVDTTLRDGNLSLWASNMTTSMLLPVLDRLGKAGFEAIELLSGAFFKKCVRELHDDPWQRARLVSERIPDVPLRLIAGRMNTFGYDPPEMYRLFQTLIARNGVKQVRLSDPWNAFDGLARRVRQARDCGLDPIINMIYSVSPRHTDDYFAERTRQAATLAAPICFKDPGGLLTPERTRALAPIILAAAGAVPVEFHTHCITGLGSQCCLEAMDAGIRIINTAIPPLAEASSNPSVFNVAANARALGYTTAIDEEVLHPITPHFSFIAQREGLPVGAPAAYDEAQYAHQVPGGMISNMAHQLRLVGKGDRLDQVLEETARVRAELGYPIMVTPLSQFVGSQAAINVVVGERYKEVTDQVIDYALGRYGEEAIDAMDPNLRDRILASPRAKELAAFVPPEQSLKEIREEMGGPTLSDEDLVLRWLTSAEDLAAMHAAPPPRPYPTSDNPLVALIAGLTGYSEFETLSVRKAGVSVRLARRPVGTI
jgi:oxaloacetate decarboxylase alpha subunit